MVRLELAVDGEGVIQDAYFSGHGCCISQAAASMLVEKISGMRVDDLKTFTAPQMLELFGARLTPNRQKCCLLGWRVLQQALYSPLKLP
jgi:nitrogen fixation NifU-like protein